MQATAGRSDVSPIVTSTRPSHFVLALTSGA